MKKIAVFYFSGTGNTKFIVQKLSDLLKPEFECVLTDIAQKQSVEAEFASADFLLFAYPIYGSSPPEPMRKFAYANRRLLCGKQVIVVITQYLFSGDGAASLGRFLEKNGATVQFAEHFNMPDNLADLPFLKIKNGSENGVTVAKAVLKAEKFVQKIKSGEPFKRGFGLVSHAIGYFSQRMFWRMGEKKKAVKLKIDPEACAKCGKCAKACPVNNIKIQDGAPIPQGKCALCYRCVNTCPMQAITLCGKHSPKTQYKGV